LDGTAERASRKKKPRFYPCIASKYADVALF
jgi:hypothetical protein